MANKTPDFTSIIRDAMENAPVDLNALQEQVKHSAAYGEKLAQIALKAAEQSNELSSKWTKQTLANVGGAAKVQEDPAALAKTISDFAALQGELASANLSAFAEIAKQVQEQTIELILAAGKDVAEETTAAAKKAATKASGK